MRILRFDALAQMFQSALQGGTDAVFGNAADLVDFTVAEVLQIKQFDDFPFPARKTADMPQQPFPLQSRRRFGRARRAVQHDFLFGQAELSELPDVVDATVPGQGVQHGKQAILFQAAPQKFPVVCEQLLPNLGTDIFAGGGIGIISVLLKIPSGQSLQQR